MTFADYIENLARTHKMVHHSDDDPHYTDLADDAQNLIAHNMGFPCIVLDDGDFDVVGTEGQPELANSATIMVLDHVADVADAAEVREAFAATKKITVDMLKRFVRDKRSGMRLLAKFSIVGSGGARIFLKDAAMYGYAITFIRNEGFNDLDCDNSWM